MIYDETNEQFYLDISMAKDGRHLILNSNSKDTSKIYTIDTAQPPNKQERYMVKEIVKSTPNVKTYVNHNGLHLIIWKSSPESSEIILRDSVGQETVVHRISPAQA